MGQVGQPNLGPRAELVEEYYAASGERIHFYVPRTYLKHALDTGENISQATVQEAKTVSRRRFVEPRLSGAATDLRRFLADDPARRDRGVVDFYGFDPAAGTGDALWRFYKTVESTPDRSDTTSLGPFYGWIPREDPWMRARWTGRAPIDPAAAKAFLDAHADANADAAEDEADEEDSEGPDAEQGQ